MNKPRKRAQIELDPPGVREVREARAALWKEAGGSVEKLIALVRQRHADKLTKPKKPINPKDD